MEEIYLFDWGNTLMVDFKGKDGKMCDWDQVQAVDGALETLKYLSQQHSIYVATNAADSGENDIKKAFARVGLDSYINGYFCKTNVGFDKSSCTFYRKIIDKLNLDPQSITMVGDTLEKDIKPALEAGIKAIWYNPQAQHTQSTYDIRQIRHLSEIYLK